MQVNQQCICLQMKVQPMRRLTRTYISIHVPYPFCVLIINCVEHIVLYAQFAKYVLFSHRKLPLLEFTELYTRLHMSALSLHL
jgi:hypothetical protein